MKQALVIHALSRYMRQTTTEFVNAFGTYAPNNTHVSFCNIRRPVNPELFKNGYDALILTYDVLSLRSSEQWDWVVETISSFAVNADQILAFPQDDYTYNQVLDEGFEYLGVDVIYSPIETGLHLVYPKMHRKSEFRVALTGYVDEQVAAQWRSKRLPIVDRPLDVGQRVRLLPPWFGFAGQDKGLFAEQFATKASAAGLKIDISTKDTDMFAGEDWYQFLQSARTTIGMKGGASLCDPDGSIMRNVQTFLTANPQAEFLEIEAACFPGLDGQAIMSAISPRLFDAAMLGTTQILTPDDYLGVLEPWKHYIPLEEDFTNFSEVTEAIQDNVLLEKIAAAAEEVLIESGDFTYATFINKVFSESIKDANHATLQPFLSDTAGELQWRLTVVLFQGVQRCIHLGKMTDSLPELLTLATTIDGLLAETPSLANRFDADILFALIGKPPLPNAVLNVIHPLVDIFIECFRLGAMPALQNWIRYWDEHSATDWQLLDWIDHEQKDTTTFTVPTIENPALVAPIQIENVRDHKPRTSAEVKIFAKEIALLSRGTTTSDVWFRQQAALYLANRIPQILSSGLYSILQEMGDAPRGLNNCISVGAGICGDHVHLAAQILEELDIPWRDIQIFYHDPIYGLLDHTVIELLWGEPSEETWHMVDVTWVFIPHQGDLTSALSFEDALDLDHREGFHSNAIPWRWNVEQNLDVFGYLSEPTVGIFVNGSGEIYREIDAKTHRLNLENEFILGESSHYLGRIGQVSQKVAIPSGAWRITLNGEMGLRDPEALPILFLDGRPLPVERNSRKLIFQVTGPCSVVLSLDNGTFRTDSANIEKIEDPSQ